MWLFLTNELTTAQESDFSGIYLVQKGIHIFKNSPNDITFCNQELYLLFDSSVMLLRDTAWASQLANWRNSLALQVKPSRIIYPAGQLTGEVK